MLRKSVSMSELALPSPDVLLRLIAESAPKPWYPSAYARSAGVPRDSLNAPLESLRMRGLAELTEWVAGSGQGYRLTDAGSGVARSPSQLDKLGRGVLPAVTPTRPVPRTGDPLDLRLRGDWSRGETVRSAVFQPGPARVTAALIVANILVFAVGYFLAERQGVAGVFLERGEGRVVHDTGGATRFDLSNGEWWRLVTCCFAHWGGTHLLFNMISLYILGRITEPVWGHGRFLVLYLLAGLGGSCAAMVYRSDSHLAGASGAIWGLTTSLMVWLWLNRRYLPDDMAADWGWRMGLVVLLGVADTLLLPNVSLSAHLGGAAVGALAALLFNAQRFGTRWRRALAVLGLLLLGPACVAPVILAVETSARAAQEKASNVNREEIDINGRLAELVDVRLRRVTVLREKVLPLFKIPPRGRSRRDLEDARDALADVRRQADELAAKMAEPYRNDRIEEARRRTRDLLAEIDRETALIDRRLERGDAWDANDQKQLDDTGASLRKAEQELEKLLG
jgi:membrane associated rhomboid family serine protease